MKAAFYIGVLFAIVLFLWYGLEYVVGLHGPHIAYHEYVSYFFAVPVVVIMAAAIRYRRRQYPSGQPLRFFPLFSFGALVSLFAALAVIPAMYIFANWLNPDFLDALATHAIDTGRMDPMLAARRFAMDSFLVLHAVLIFIVGTVAAFVISIIMTGKRETQQVQTV